MKCFRTSTISLALLSRLSRAARSNVTTWNLGSIANLALVESINLGSGFPSRNYKLLLDLIQNISPARSHNNPEMDCFQNSRVVTTRNNLALKSPCYTKETFLGSLDLVHTVKPCPFSVQHNCKLLSNPTAGTSDHHHLNSS